MTIGPGPLLVFERLGVGELLLGLWCTRRSGHVRYFRASKIAARLAARASRCQLLRLADFPARYTPIQDLARQWDDEERLGAAIDRSRLRLFQKRHPAFDFSLAIKKGLLWYYERRAATALFMLDFAQCTTPIYLYPEDDFPFENEWSIEVRRNIVIQRGRGYRLLRSFNALIGNLVESAELFFRAAHFMWRHRSIEQLPDRSFPLAARLHDYLHGEKDRSTFNSYCNYDVFCVNGEYYARHFQSLGACVTHFEATGSHILDWFYRAQQNGPSDQLKAMTRGYKVVAAYSTGVDERYLATKDVAIRFFRAMQAYAEHNPQALVIFRLHPAEFGAAWAIETYRSDPPRLQVVGPEVATYDLMTLADLVTTPFSTVGIEALAGGKPTVFINLTGDPELLNYHYYSPRLMISDECEINAAFDRYLSGERVIPIDLQDDITRAHMTAFDGQAAKRIGAVLRRYADGEKPA
jgi:hypothetical protein